MFAEFSQLNLSDKIPAHIFTSEILLHLLDLVDQLLDGRQIAGNPAQHKEFLRVLLKRFWVTGQTDWKREREVGLQMISVCPVLYMKIHILEFLSSSKADIN